MLPEESLVIDQIGSLILIICLLCWFGGLWLLRKGQYFGIWVFFEDAPTFGLSSLLFLSLAHLFLVDTGQLVQKYPIERPTGFELEGIFQDCLIYHKYCGFIRKTVNVLLRILTEDEAFQIINPPIFDDLLLLFAFRYELALHNVYQRWLQCLIGYHILLFDSIEGKISGKFALLLGVHFAPKKGAPLRSQIFAYFLFLHSLELLIAFAYLLSFGDLGAVVLHHPAQHAIL